MPSQVGASRKPRFLQPGGHTAYGSMVDYRLGKLQRRRILGGDWLDIGCAEGYYTDALARCGARKAVGIEVNGALIEAARSRSLHEAVSFQTAAGERLPFESDSFDGVLLNEVLEHVVDEARTLREIGRVLRPGGHLALFSPNRWFPFEGHGARLNDEKVLMSRPVPVMPWLPARWTRRFATARNYWPRDLARLVEGAGLHVVETGWALAQFEQYPWVPQAVLRPYRRDMDRIERSPIARFLAVSTFIVGRAR